MAENEKIMHFANFNITYGSKQEPMLEHFEDIIFPAFTSDFRSGKPDKRPIFYFDDVGIKEMDGEYVLVGNYIKDTEYDIYTTVQDGKLVPTPSTVPTAPYSRFIIFLKNHRMVLVRNESRSPDIRSFQAATRNLLNHYVRKTNQTIKEKDKRLPSALVNIVDIPLQKNIEEVLKNVSKISWLKFRFFPLNNDISPIPIAENIGEEMKKIKSDRAHIQFTSPGSKPEIKDLIQRSAGLAVATLEVVDGNGNKTKIKEGKFTSNKRIPFDRDILSSDDQFIIGQAKKDVVITAVSESNYALYQRFKAVIKKLTG